MKPPTITTLISCKDHGKYLGQAIDTILKQTFKPNEIILINDGSKDHTAQVMRKYGEKDKRFIQVTHETSLGNIRSYNHGIDLCKSEYFHLMAADDLLADCYFYEEACLALMQDKSLAFASIGLQWMDEDGKLQELQCLPPIAGKLTSVAALELFQVGGNFVNGGGTLVRSDVQRSVGYYDRQFPFSADALNWIKIWGKGYASYHFKRPGYLYRRHKQQMTVDHHSGPPIKEQEGLRKAIGEALQSLNQPRVRELQI